jgi:hypothetical protein
MDPAVETTLKSLRSRHIEALFAESPENAKEKILELIPRDTVVGIGDSTTVAQIGVKEDLKARGTKVLDGFDRKIKYRSEGARRKLLKESTVCDVFLTGTNAVTQDGKLVNVDAVGNRVAGMFWGHPTVIIVVGRNKIVKDLDEAFHQLRKTIAPTHIRIRAAELGGRRVETPCVTTGKCNDCKAENRMCNVFTIIEGKPLRTSIKVVVIDEDLGLGWDESWPPERIARIIQNYKDSVWIPTPNT